MCVIKSSLTSDSRLILGVLQQYLFKRTDTNKDYLVDLAFISNVQLFICFVFVFRPKFKMHTSKKTKQNKTNWYVTIYSRESWHVKLFSLHKNNNKCTINKWKNVNIYVGFLSFLFLFWWWNSWNSECSNGDWQLSSHLLQMYRTQGWAGKSLSFPVSPWPTFTCSHEAVSGVWNNETPISRGGNEISPHGFSPSRPQKRDELVRQ